jgi:hypothetical protein
MDGPNDGNERLNEENQRLQEQVRDGFRFESNMDDLQGLAEDKFDAGGGASSHLASPF